MWGVGENIREFRSVWIMVTVREMLHSCLLSDQLVRQLMLFCSVSLSSFVSGAIQVSYCDCDCWLQRYVTCSWTPTGVPSLVWSGKNGSTRKRWKRRWSVALVRSSIDLLKLPSLHVHVRRRYTGLSQSAVTARSMSTPARRFSRCRSRRRSPNDCGQKRHVADVFSFCYCNFTPFAFRPVRVFAVVPFC